MDYFVKETNINYPWQFFGKIILNAVSLVFSIRYSHQAYVVAKLNPGI